LICTFQVKLQLDEEGLQLWKASLHNATTVEPAAPGVPGLIDLVPTAISMLADNLDILGSLLSITESYILISGDKVFQVCAFASPPLCHSIEP
jgi:hypothetical protein